MALTPEQIEEMRRLYEETPLSASKIALRFGVTKNAVVSRAYRLGWDSFVPANGAPEKVETLFDRMDRLEREFAAKVDA